MNDTHYWRFVDELSVDEATLLILGVTPYGSDESVDDWQSDQVPQGFYPLRSAIRAAVVAGKLKANIRRKSSDIGWIEAPPASLVTKIDIDRIEAFFQVDPDWRATKVDVAALREWTLSKGLVSRFFCPIATESADYPNADYLNKEDPCFSRKLYAAIEAWKNVRSSDASRLNKSVKSALTDWLTKHAASHGLTKNDGTLNQQAIADVAKVANWDTKGGAPKTPTKPSNPFSSSIH